MSRSNAAWEGRDVLDKTLGAPAVQVSHSSRLGVPGNRVLSLWGHPTHQDVDREVTDLRPLSGPETAVPGPVDDCVVLSYLLPGLRELRAPLAAGYIWLLSAWLLFHDDIPSRDESTGLLREIYELADGLGSTGKAIVVSFAAYLIGSLSKKFFWQFLNLAGTVAHPSLW
jgi:hypothetical protein